MMLLEYATCFYISLITLMHILFLKLIYNMGILLRVGETGAERVYFVHSVCSLNICVYVKVSETKKLCCC